MRRIKNTFLIQAIKNNFKGMVIIKVRKIHKITV